MHDNAFSSIELVQLRFLAIENALGTWIGGCRCLQFSYITFDIAGTAKNVDRDPKPTSEPRASPLNFALREGDVTHIQPGCILLPCAGP